MEDAINRTTEEHDKIVEKHAKKALRKALTSATIQMEQTGKISKSTSEIIKGLVRVLSNVV
jgi:fructose-1,6-bisphosphatase/inositol monophosphatase family enzyme